jgi:hypothetical protein
MTKIEGRFLAHRLDNGGVQMQFVPNQGAGNPYSLVAKGAREVQSDLESVFGFTPAKAAAAVAELGATGEVDVAIAVNEENVRALFHPRSQFASLYPFGFLQPAGLGLCLRDSILRSTHPALPPKEGGRTGHPA